MALPVAQNYNPAKLDMVTAFLNLNLDEIIYYKLPEGFTNIDGIFLLLLLAFFRLHYSGKCWQNNITIKMLTLGLHQVFEEPCLFMISQSAEITDS
jgi:hypothetical protein